MKSFPLNLSKFKKVRSDEKSTTLVDKSGHEIKIAHSALNRDLKNMLKGIPAVEADQTQSQVPAMNQAPQLPQAPQMPEMMADGGESGDASLATDVEDEDIGAVPEAQKQLSNPDQAGAAMVPAAVDQAIPVAANAAAPSAPSNLGPYNPNAIPSPTQNDVQMAAAANMGLTQEDIANNPEYNKVPLSSAQAIPTQPQAGQLFNPYQAKTEAIQKYVSDVNEINQNKADLTQNYGEQAAGVYENMARTDKVAGDYLMDSLNQNREEAKNLRKDILDKNIDSRAFMKNASDHDKTMLKVSLAFGAIGQAFTGQNLGLELLNKQMDSDYKDQLANLGKKENLLGAIYKDTGDLMTASKLYSGLQHSYWANMLNSYAAKFQGSNFQRAAQLNAVDLDYKSKQLTQDWEFSKSLLNAVDKGAVIDPAVATNVVGGNPQQQQKMQEEIAEHNKIEAIRQYANSNFDKIIALDPLHGGYNQEMRDTYRASLKGYISMLQTKRFSGEYADELVKHIYPDPDDILHKRNIPERRIQMNSLFDVAQKGIMPTVESNPIMKKIVSNHDRALSAYMGQGQKAIKEAPPQPRTQARPNP